VPVETTAARAVTPLRCDTLISHSLKFQRLLTCRSSGRKAMAGGREGAMDGDVDADKLKFGVEFRFPPGAHRPCATFGV
jgi:hypothetical protein